VVVVVVLQVTVSVMVLTAVLVVVAEDFLAVQVVPETYLQHHLRKEITVGLVQAILVLKVLVVVVVPVLLVRLVQAHPVVMVGLVNHQASLGHL
jgi:hypothetical protein